MKWKEILKNYKPMSHAVQGQRNLGREMKDPTPNNLERDFDVSRLAYVLKPEQQEYILNVAENNPDGSVRTMKDVAEHFKTQGGGSEEGIMSLLAAMGKENMTVKEYKEWI